MDPKALVRLPRRYPVTTVYVAVTSVLFVLLGFVEAAR